MHTATQAYNRVTGPWKTLNAIIVFCLAVPEYRHLDTSLSHAFPSPVIHCNRRTTPQILMNT